MCSSIERWINSALILITDTIKKSYDDALCELYNNVPDAKDLFESHIDYLGRRVNAGHFIDLILCLFPYRDLQYGFKGERNKTKKLKLSWIAFHILALEKLLKNEDRFRKELEKIAEEKGEKRFEKEEINFIINYVNTTIAELSALYVYIMIDKTVLPFGFMQHAITSSRSKGPTLGDFIEVDTLTFVDIKASKNQVNKDGLIRLMVSTRLPSAFIVPRYAIDFNKRTIDNTKIVLDRYTLGAFGGIDRIPNYCEAKIMDDHMSILSSISLLKRNANALLQKKS